MKVLVTGAGGFVGGYLVHLLLEHGHEVASVGIGSNETLKKLRIPVYEADICDYSGIRHCMQEAFPDAVIHLAAISNVPIAWENPAHAVNVNIRGTVHVLQALYEVNSKARFLNIGSSDQYGLAAKSGEPLTEDVPCQPQNPYSISKLCAEQMVLQLGKKYGMTVISTRSFNHFGPGQARGFVVADFASQISAIERGEQEAVMRVGDLSACRDFTFVEDVVEAYAALIEKDVPGGVYNVCSGKARSVQAVLDTLLSFAKRKIRVERDPRKMRASEVPYFLGDATKLEQALGWKPRRDFGEGMRLTMEYWGKLLI